MENTFDTLAVLPSREQQNLLSKRSKNAVLCSYGYLSSDKSNENRKFIIERIFGLTEGRTKIGNVDMLTLLVETGLYATVSGSYADIVGENNLIDIHEVRRFTEDLIATDIGALTVYTDEKGERKIRAVGADTLFSFYHNGKKYYSEIIIYNQSTNSDTNNINNNFLNYDKNKKYPLVLFMHDMGVLSEDTKATLLQGNGAISFATPEEQAKHEAFVLAPQYSRQVVNDNGDITSDLDATVNLVKDHLLSKYSIDEKKLYATGQSMGGMMAIVMNFKYPDLFAASYLVACQWNEKEVTPMAKNNLWIMVSTGDEKAYPGMNTITSELIKRGATVARDTWKADYTNEQFLEGARKVIAQKSNIKYTTLEKGTNPYLAKNANPGSEHAGTWKVAYSISGIKDWIFSQAKQ